MLSPPFVIPLSSSSASLENVGGKGANLARLVRAGFPVPGGFLIPTSAYRGYVAANELDQVLRAALRDLDVGAPAALEDASSQIRTHFSAGVVPEELIRALKESYRELGEPAVAVRSSATAEDLPDMSFAGQQDTYLNIQGANALCEAVVNCWGSLWTARAIGYRARNDIAHEDVALAVVVQEMVQSEASGVLFTANPLNGRRTEIVIDATLGLGEALVSGQVEPDHYVVDAARGLILSKSLGAKATIISARPSGGTITETAHAAGHQALSDEVILDLAVLGGQVAAEYDFPQDIEWARYKGKLFLLQSRPITSLYPVPEGMAPDPLKVMMAFSAVQGIVEPLTPLGQDTMITVLSGGGRVLGIDRDIDSQTAFYVAAERLWIDFSPILSNSIGRRILPTVLGAIDPGVAQALRELIEDPRLAPQRPGIRFATLRRILPFAFGTLRRVRRIWRDPERERERILRAMDDKVAETDERVKSTGDSWADYDQHLALLGKARDIFPEMVIPQGMTAVVAGMIPFFGILARFAKQAARSTGQPDLAHIHLAIARGLPHNVTIEMDLALWQTAQTVRKDPDSAETFNNMSASDLADGYLNGSLPSVVQEAVGAFMDQYGMRGLGEIDIGRPRWREQPAHIMQVLQSYLAIDDPLLAPDAVFARGAESAAVAGVRLEDAIRSTHGGRLKVRLVHWAISRYRALAGMREAPKFFAIRMMSIMRQGLLRSGRAFVNEGLLAEPDDLFLLHINELKEISARRGISSEMRARIVDRRALRQREMRRRQLPRVLLSDGTAYYEGVRAVEGDENTVMGDPVSPGVVEGTVRVVFNPNSTQLMPGEILVCPGTDPAWTPLFLAAGGLVMEVGGMMTHGSVVAREYGIPAVVGVDQATTRLQTGQRVRVNGSTGAISILA